jgi:hypothetical protein
MPINEYQQVHNGPGQDLPQATNTWFDAGLHGLGDEPSWAEENYDITGNGLYWFWDSAWTEPRPL